VIAEQRLGGTVNPFRAAQTRISPADMGTVLDQVLARKYPTYGIGLQMTLAGALTGFAEADLARDELASQRSRRSA